MKFVSVGSGQYAVVDDADYPLVAGKTWHLIREGYAQHTWREGKRRYNVSMHRLILNPPDDLLTDHVDGDRLNNTRANLRPASPQENAANTQRKLPESGFRGVYRYNKTRWSAIISKNKRQVRVGVFDTSEEAARAYDAAAIEIYGDFAFLNFPKLPSRQNTTIVV